MTLSPAICELNSLLAEAAVDRACAEHGACCPHCGSLLPDSGLCHACPAEVECK
jgi:hypothetical protein